MAVLIQQHSTPQLQLGPAPAPCLRPPVPQPTSAPSSAEVSPVNLSEQLQQQLQQQHLQQQQLQQQQLQQQQLQQQQRAHESQCQTAASDLAEELPQKLGPFLSGECIRLRKGDVNYQLLGPPTAPLVVCLHGLNGSISSFSYFAPLLVQAGFRVLCFDLYGFGLSASPSGRLDLETYIEQVRSLLDALRVPSDQKVNFLGFSMGGVVAVEYANRYPQRIDKLLLVSPGGLMQKSETPCQPLLFGCLRTRCGDCLLHVATALALCCSCCIRRYLGRGDKLQKSFTPDVREPEKFKRESQETGERFLWNVKRSVNSYLRALRRMPLWEDDFKNAYDTLARGSVPVLFIWGDSDCTVPLYEAEAEVKNIFGPHGVSCVQIEDAGHGLLMEDATKVAAFAIKWFSGANDSSWQQVLSHWRLAAQDGSLPGPTALGSAV